ncbi:MAG: flagellar biosynthetic protein FliR [Deltaproteobacteria bacterium]|nr:flagellar biosynthetic protein FliR [Deltaproteobacteria bacterium]
MSEAGLRELLELLVGEGGGAEALLLVVGLLARLLPLVWVTPIFGAKLIPRSARVVVGLALAALCYPVAAAQAPPEGVSALLLLGEVAVGLALGFVASLVFHGAQAAGVAVDAARGASNSEVFLPQSGGRSSPMGSLYFQLAIVLFFALGGHRLFLSVVVGSYIMLPMGALPPAEGLLPFTLFVARLTADVWVLAVAWAAPVLAATLLADISLGWINRFVPQLNVFFLAMPLKALLGIAVVVLGASLLAAALPESLAQGVAAVERSLELMSSRP